MLRIFRKNNPSKSRSESKRLRLPSMSVSKIGNLAPWIMLILLVVGILFITGSSKFKISKLECSYIYDNPCPTEVDKELEIFIGQHVFGVDEFDIKNKLTSAIPSAKDIKVSVVFPNKILVDFVPNNVVAQLSTGSGERVVLISDNFRVIGVSDLKLPDLPIIIYPQGSGLKMGQRVSDMALNSSIQLIQELEYEAIYFGQIEIVSADQVLVDLEEDKIGVFSPSVDIISQVESLQLILMKAKIEESKPYVDVRFNQPVLKSNL